GKPGSIARSVIMRVRADLGLTRRHGKPKAGGTGPKAQRGATVGNGLAKRPAAASAANPGRDQGKSAFLRVLYKKNPNARFKEVNEAWKSAGNPGTISEPLTYLVRSEMGITKKRGIKPKAKAPVAMAKKPTPGRDGRSGSPAATVAVSSPQGKS